MKSDRQPTKTATSLLALIRLYQKNGSPVVARRVSCRFHPTCSTYAALAVERHGTRRGTVMALKRWLRCNPKNWQSCIDFP